MYLAGNISSEKEIFIYHNVFASALANYINLRKEIEKTREERTKENMIAEAEAILKTCTFYAIMLKRKAYENEIDEIPTNDEVGMVSWWNGKKEEYRIRGLNKVEILDALFVLCVKKQELAGLTASTEKEYISKTDLLLEKEMEEGKK